MAMVSRHRKDSLRAAVLAQRAALSPSVWTAQDRARTEHVLARLAGRSGTVALYASLPGEPGTTALIDALADAGWTVLLPVLRRRVDWAEFASWGQMVPGWRDIPEPARPRLGPEALARADLILVSALSVGMDGSRLGTGGGWYDRALPSRSPGTPVVALARGAEVVASLPMEEHDVAVQGVVTETGWVDL